jgi:hypothetical protein
VWIAAIAVSLEAAHIHQTTQLHIADGRISENPYLFPTIIKFLSFSALFHNM